MREGGWGGGWGEGNANFCLQMGSGVEHNTECSHREHLPLPWEIVLSRVVPVTLEDKQLVMQKEI